MRVLLVSKFLHHVGGVETYLAWQARSLRAAGHEVGLVGMAPPDGAAPLFSTADDVWFTPTRRFEAGAPGRVHSAAASVYSVATGRVMARALSEFGADLVHFHGTCYQLTPSVVRAASHAHLPVVLTAHEYKLMCANQTFFDDASRTLCTDCLRGPGVRSLVSPVRHRCMKGSLLVSTLGAVETQVANATWRAAAPLVLTPSVFMRDRLVEYGWAPQRVHHLDLPWPEQRRSTERSRRSVLFFGRLVPEKGAHLLLRAWHEIAARHPDVELRLAGDGPQRQELESMVDHDAIPRVTFLGKLVPAEVAAELDTAIVTAHPALWWENSPFAVRESLVAGVPALVSARGGLPELIGPESGAVVPDDRPSAWAAALSSALEHRRAGSAVLTGAVAARLTTPEQHLTALVSHYSSLLAEHAAASDRGPAPTSFVKIGA